jgi:FlaA1/EpsC-like NDP-sugar epimerase
MSRVDDFCRSAVFVIAHVAVAAAANLAAFLLRFDGAIPHGYLVRGLGALPLLLLTRALALVAFDVHRSVWRYAGISELRDLILAAGAGTAAFALLQHASVGLDGYPRSILLIDCVLFVSFSGGARLAWRLRRDLWRARPRRRVLIYGAGDAGETVVRDMMARPGVPYRPIGFIDDDRRKIGRRIHGVPVLGARTDLHDVIARHRPDELLIAAPSGGAKLMRDLVGVLESVKLPIKTLPSVDDIMKGHVSISHIRKLSIEDLLPRPAVGLEREPVRALIEGKRVLVTGAGGSIGSELCRQIAALAPSRLVLLERYENSLFAIANELQDRNAACPLVPLVGDVTDRRRLDDAFSAWRPQIVFHAAAHKHVPLMELNPCEAVKNNVAGTRAVADAAARHHVERFVFISTDKAVNPTNVMGVTKRVAEMVVQAMARRTDTRFAAVRFGNVLGSNGSVVPRFVEQIHAGGPVTVTHPEIKRYFMLIPEAVHLVLHAAALAQGGEVFVLEMGEQIRIIEMARNLIRLAGFVPDEDISIVFTGLRPGEKLFEELVADDEAVEPSGVEKIHRVRPDCLPNPALLRERLFTLIRAATAGDQQTVIRTLRQIVPTYSGSSDAVRVPTEKARHPQAGRPEQEENGEPWVA